MGGIGNFDKMNTQTNLLASSSRQVKDSEANIHKVEIIVDEADKDKDFNERRNGDKPVKIDTV